jgi:hypothetical protein
MQLLVIQHPVNQTGNLLKTPEQVKPLRRAPPRKTAYARKKQHTRILTDTLEKEKIAEESAVRRMKKINLQNWTNLKVR